VARHIFQSCLVWIYTQSNITSIKNKIVCDSQYGFRKKHSIILTF
jgi:hypothetical protein